MENLRKFLIFVEKSRNPEGYGSAVFVRLIGYKNACRAA